VARPFGWKNTRLNKGWSAADHRYAEILHKANRTLGGEIARVHRSLADAVRSPVVARGRGLAPESHKSGHSHATLRGNRAGEWDVEAGRGLTYDRIDDRGPLLIFNIRRHVTSTGNSHVSPSELDDITREIAAFLNRKKRKLKPLPQDQR